MAPPESTGYNDPGDDAGTPPASRSAGDISRQAGSQLEAVLVNLPEALLIVDLQGRILLTNPEAGQLLGHEPAELQGQTFGTPTSEAGPQEVHRPMGQGKIRVLEMRGRKIPWEGQQVWLITFHDITERKHQEREINLLAATFESAEAIMIVDGQARIERVNEAFTQLTGYLPEELIGRNPRILQSGRHDDAFYDAMWRTLAETGKWEGEIWNRRKDGTIYPQWESITVVYGEGGGIDHYVAILQDISERKRLEAELEHQARIDKLTGLHNRARFQVLLEHEMERAQRYQSPMALVMFDLDHFKKVNDDHGHNAGDHVLRVIADTAVGQIRESDALGRWGGEEFMLLLPETSSTGATELAERIRKEIAQIRFEKVGRVTVSLGVTELACGDTLSVLVERVDRALYRAKDGGRNRVEGLPAPHDDADPG